MSESAVAVSQEARSSDVAAVSAEEMNVHDP